MREYRTRLISDVVTGKCDVRNVKCEEIEEDTIIEEETAEDIEDGDFSEGIDDVD
jgi:hypothetical protein